MIIIISGKRKCFSDRSRNTLPECASESFDMIRLSGFLSGGSVPVFRYDIFICFQKIRMTDSALTVNTRKGFPQFFSVFPCPVSDMEPCDLTLFSVMGMSVFLIFPELHFGQFIKKSFH